MIESGVDWPARAFLRQTLPGLGQLLKHALDDGPHGGCVLDVHEQHLRSALVGRGGLGEQRARGLRALHQKAVVVDVAEEVSRR